MRVQVWEDPHWRMTTALLGEVPGFSFLEPKRHIRYLHELDGAEATTFGAVLAECMCAVKQATDAELVYVYVFGGSFDHLHVHLAPHHEGGALNDSMIKGEVVETELDSGAIVQTSEDFPLRPEVEMRKVADLIRGSWDSQPAGSSPEHPESASGEVETRSAAIGSAGHTRLRRITVSYTRGP
ncbi:hypothetical protein SAMN04487904_10260 [Actinopolyspora lacussalsi subsp. righensis]|uniref:HIT domain-containing protein n=2 Tax=Actinopolyspora righensis TaxID=995060 RepID=A0A1I6XYU9_9ACTN|nr:hypothetical protein SAMN04487904_10260 [Actinopolyspora righensis]